MRENEMRIAAEMVADILAMKDIADSCGLLAVYEKISRSYAYTYRVLGEGTVSDAFNFRVTEKTAMIFMLESVDYLINLKSREDLEADLKEIEKTEGRDSLVYRLCFMGKIGLMNLNQFERSMLKEVVLVVIPEESRDGVKKMLAELERADFEENPKGIFLLATERYREVSEKYGTILQKAVQNFVKKLNMTEKQNFVRARRDSEALAILLNYGVSQEEGFQLFTLLNKERQMELLDVMRNSRGAGSDHVKFTFKEALKTLLSKYPAEKTDIGEIKNELHRVGRMDKRDIEILRDGIHQCVEQKNPGVITECIKFILQVDQMVQKEGLQGLEKIDAEMVDKRVCGITGEFFGFFRNLLLQEVAVAEANSLCLERLQEIQGTDGSMPVFLCWLIKFGLLMSIGEYVPRYEVRCILLTCVPPQYREEVSQALGEEDSVGNSRESLRTYCNLFREQKELMRGSCISALHARLGELEKDEIKLWLKALGLKRYTFVIPFLPDEAVDVLWECLPKDETRLYAEREVALLYLHYRQKKIAPDIFRRQGRKALYILSDLFIEGKIIQDAEDVDSAFSEEFGIRSKELGNLEETKRQDAYAKLREVVKQMADYCTLARREGLLVLEDAALELEEKSSGKELAWMIRLIVKGFEPSHTEDMMLLRYYAQQRSVVEALIYLMQMYASLMIQAGLSERLVEVKLLAMLPAEVEEAYRRELRRI